MDEERDGWVRTAERFDGAPGWLLVDGSALGLGALLERVPPGSAALDDGAQRIRTFAPQPAASSGALCGLRVAFVTSTSVFTFDGNVIATVQGMTPLPRKPKYETRQTGGMLATLNIMRYLFGHVALEVLAVELFEAKLASEQSRTAVEMWEGRPVRRGSTSALLAHANASGRPYDVVIAAYLDPRLVGLTLDLPARRKAAVVHDHHQLPWGPWVETLSPLWAETVARLDGLLCTSDDVAAYARAHHSASNASPPPSGQLATRALAVYACPATDYHHASSDPHRALPLDLPTLRPWEGGHEFVTMVRA